MPEAPVKMTPMFEQYLRIKAEHPDALLFYRMGDFYELFFDDARTAARELRIALTSRSRDAENPVPMCGVPWHAVESYVAQLIGKGYQIAICDQTEDPKAAKGLVKRAVTSYHAGHGTRRTPTSRPRATTIWALYAAAPDQGRRLCLGGTSPPASGPA